MDAAQTIRDAIADVTALRMHRTGDPALGAAVGSVKSLQARRFRGTYADLMASPAFGPAARFFLEELYSDTDYTDRDQQFGRIAGTLQTVFPQPVVNTAVALAVLHAQTEELDQDMGRAWLAQEEGADAAHRVIAVVGVCTLLALIFGGVCLALLVRRLDSSLGGDPVAVAAAAAAVAQGDLSQALPGAVPGSVIESMRRMQGQPAAGARRRLSDKN